MIDTSELVGLIAKNGLNKKQVAIALGLTPKTFSAKLKKGDFKISEASLLINLLNIENPAGIFFAN